MIDNRKFDSIIITYTQKKVKEGTYDDFSIYDGNCEWYEVRFASEKARDNVLARKHQYLYIYQSSDSLHSPKSISHFAEITYEKSDFSSDGKPSIVLGIKNNKLQKLDCILQFIDNKPSQKYSIASPKGFAEASKSSIDKAKFINDIQFYTTKSK